jgi:hypothetical protein
LAIRRILTSGFEKPYFRNACMDTRVIEESEAGLTNEGSGSYNDEKPKIQLSQ